jgi:hypothetical protein
MNLGTGALCGTGVTNSMRQSSGSNTPDLESPQLLPLFIHVPPFALFFLLNHATSWVYTVHHILLVISLSCRASDTTVEGSTRPPRSEWSITTMSSKSRTLPGILSRSCTITLVLVATDSKYQSLSFVMARNSPSVRVVVS